MSTQGLQCHIGSVTFSQYDGNNHSKNAFLRENTLPQESTIFPNQVLCYILSHALQLPVSIDIRSWWLFAIVARRGIKDRIDTLGSGQPLLYRHGGGMTKGPICSTKRNSIAFTWVNILLVGIKVRRAID